MTFCAKTALALPTVKQRNIIIKPAEKQKERKEQSREKKLKRFVNFVPKTELFVVVFVLFF